MIKFCFVIFVILISFYQGNGLNGNLKKSICPEEKKLHPGDCRLFYQCVPLKSEQTFVWLPMHCITGTSFHSKLKRCVPYQSINDCSHFVPKEKFPEETYAAELNQSLNINLKKWLNYMVNNSENQFFKTPADYRLNVSPERIQTQMERIYKIINNNAKKIPKNPPQNNSSIIGFPFFAINEMNLYSSENKSYMEKRYLLKHKTSIQSVSTPTNPNEHHQTNLDMLTNKLNEFPFNASIGTNEGLKYYPTQEYLISKLFEKHLGNKSFMDNHLEAKNSVSSFSISSKTKLSISSQNSRRDKNFCEKYVKIENDEDCMKYFFCNSKDAVFHLDCLDVKSYDKKNDECNFNLFRTCSKSKSVEENHILPFFCDLIKRLPDLTSHQHYFICSFQEQKWKQTRLRCPNGFTFLKKTKSCGIDKRHNIHTLH